MQGRWRSEQTRDSGARALSYPMPGWAMARVLAVRDDEGNDQLRTSRHDLLRPNKLLSYV